ncbi:MAG: hypothetical protein E3J78_03955 [Candidatus Cloacimonadota bacterium]|nr:MAG: hypothetical protein E3J78_03955 [Candidatus Cloacimonadota bacterium]
MNDKGTGIIDFILVIFIVTAVFADSPITSTYFASEYNDITMVRKAEDSDGILTKEFAKFLSSDKNPVDVKAAVINALSWDINGKSNATFYFEYLQQKYYGDKIDNLSFEQLNADEIFCLGYLTAMDDYFDVMDALDMLDVAWSKNDRSFTVSMIYAIVEAQDAMDYDWCEVWFLTEDVLLDESLIMDMRKEAVTAIVDYMRLYEEYCEDYDDYNDYDGNDEQ